MTNGWKEVPLGTLLTRIKNEVLIQDFERYQRLTIHGNNKGISIRDEFEGHQIGTKKQFVVHRGQFLLSKIDAMNGAFGIVPEYVERGIITSNFWAYDVDERNLLPKYFNYLTHTRTFQQFCIQSSSGTTHRKYLQEDLFLGKEIPLPALEEQHRIVNRVEILSARIAKAESLREEADEEASKLFSAQSFRLFSEVMEKYETKSFGSFSPHVTSGPRYWRDRYSNNGHRFYRAQDIGSRGNILPDSKAYVTPPDSDQGKTALLEHGDLMIVITGATVGRCAVYTDDLEAGYVSQHVSICRLHKIKFCRDMLYCGYSVQMGNNNYLGKDTGKVNLV